MASKSSNFDPDEELSEFCTQLWNLDENKCVPNEDYEIDLQGYVTTTRHTNRDYARDHLFTWLDEDRVFERETYKAFRALLDNYETETGSREEVSEQEYTENCHFLEVVMETALMKECHAFLASHEVAPAEEEEFKELLYSIWFKLYKRKREDRCLDSSGFEHVFVGETRTHEVIGFHNWVQIYLQEKRGNIDYRGYFRRGTSNEESPQLITLQFIWKKYQAKPIGSSFIGCSPEFEIALYTLIHLMDRGEKVQLRIADYDVEIHCFPHGRQSIGTAYPVSKCD